MMEACVGSPQEGQGPPADEKGAGHVDGEDAVPLVEGGVFDRLLDLDAGGIDDDVEPTLFSFDGVDGGGHFRLGGDVESEIGSPAAGTVGIGTRGTPPFGEIGGVDEGPLVDKTPADRPTGSPTPTGYQRHPPRPASRSSVTAIAVVEAAR